MSSVSVVIPAHNAKKFIGEAIDSVLQQDWPADEIIVVDDGSTDWDYSALEAVAPNIRVSSQTNKGVSAARNRGCELARGPYVAILDADDIWLPGKLKAQMHHLAANPAVDAVFASGLGWEPVPGGDHWVQPAVVPGATPSEAGAVRLYYRDFLYDIPIASSTMVIKKATWEAIGGFNESKRYGEDQDFNLRLSYAHSVDLLKFVGMLYRKHGSNATARVQEPNHWADVVSESLNKLGYSDRNGVHADAVRVARRLAQIHFLHGYDHFWRGSSRIARREFTRALAKNPRDLRSAAYLAMTCVPGIRQLTARRAARPSSRPPAVSPPPPPRTTPEP